MAKKPIHPRTVSRAKKTKTKPAEAVSEAQSLSLTQSSLPQLGISPKAVLITCAVLACLSFLIWKGHRPAQAPATGGGAAPVAPPHPFWGPEVKMEAVDQFSLPEGDVEGLQADSQGTVYVLTHTSIFSYAGGQLSKSIDLKVNGQYMNMNSDDNSLYVTVAGDPNVLKVPKSLSRIQKIKIADATSLLGVASSPDGHLYAGDLAKHVVHVRDSQGRGKGEIGGPDGVICPVDVVLDPQGDVFVHDHLAGKIFRFGAKGSHMKDWPVPWTDHSSGWERLCVLQGKVYISGFSDGRLMIQDTQGTPLAQCHELVDGTRLDHPQMVGAGRNGFLYVKCQNTIYKLKPWGAAGAEGPAQAPAQVSPSAAK